MDRSSLNLPNATWHLLIVASSQPPFKISSPCGNGRMAPPQASPKPAWALSLVCHLLGWPVQYTLYTWSWDQASEDQEYHCISCGPNSHVLQLFFPCNEQPKQHILAHKSEQPTAGCVAIFHRYCCYIKQGGIITNFNLWNPWGYVTDM